MPYIFVLVVALIIGLIADGYGHALAMFGALVGVLLVIFFVAACVVGIMQGTKQKTAALKAEAELKASRPHRALRLETEAQAKSASYDPDKFILVPITLFQQWTAQNPAAADALAATPAPEGAAATDDELNRLRRLAGLDENGGAK